MRTGALCYGNSKQDKNEFTKTHLPTCQSFELPQVLSNIKLLKYHSWHVMHLISTATFGQTRTDFKGILTWTQLNLLVRKISIVLMMKNKASEGVSCNNETVNTSNVSISRQQEIQRSDKQQIDQIGPLTFSPTPSLDNGDLQEISTSADDDQAELMQWHFCLGHLPFNQLKQLAKMARY